MTAFLAIDGDDIGRRITSYYLRNDALGLRELSERLNQVTDSMAALLKSRGFTVVFCAADGVTAACADTIDASTVFNDLQALSVDEITFSMGVGESLREAYVALLDAKCNGKNRFTVFRDLPKTM